jgi:hypothetical protein
VTLTAAFHGNNGGMWARSFMVITRLRRDTIQIWLPEPRPKITVRADQPQCPRARSAPHIQLLWVRLVLVCQKLDAFFPHFADCAFVDHTSPGGFRCTRHPKKKGLLGRSIGNNEPRESANLSWHAATMLWRKITRRLLEVGTYEAGFRPADLKLKNVAWHNMPNQPVSDPQFFCAIWLRKLAPKQIRR